MLYARMNFLRAVRFSPLSAYVASNGRRVEKHHEISDFYSEHSVIN